MVPHGGPTPLALLSSLDAQMKVRGEGSSIWCSSSIVDSWSYRIWSLTLHSGFLPWYPTHLVSRRCWGVGDLPGWAPPSRPSFSLDRSVWKLTWPLPWRNGQCLGLCNPLSVQYVISSYKSSILSSSVCIFVILECRRGRSPPLWSEDQRTPGALLQEGAFLLVSSHSILKSVTGDAVQW